MLGFLREARYAVRGLAAAPQFALAAVITLALATGANVAMFSLAYGVLLRPLPYHDAGRLVVPRAEVDYEGAPRPVPVFVQPGDLDLWQRPLDGLAMTAFHASGAVALAGNDGAELLDSAVVSSGFFATVQGRLVAGRPLGPADDAIPSAVISARLATRLFGDAATAIGRTLPLTPHAYTIVGVTDDGFQMPTARIDVWVPAGFARTVNPQCCGFQVLARLGPDGTAGRAREAVRPLFSAAAAGSRARPHEVRTTVATLADDRAAAVRPALGMLSASVFLVLLVACGNLVNLVLARHAGREREFAARRAVGASALQLTRQLLAESAVLALAGTAVGVALARAILSALTPVVAAIVPRPDAVRLDAPVLLFSAALAVLATVVTGTVPAWRAVTHSGAGRRLMPTGTTKRARHLQQTLCVAQVALAVMLLIGATLMGRSLVRLLRVDLGASTERVVTASLNLAFGERPTDADTVARVARVVDHVRALPGVEAVGVGTSLPPNVSRIRLTLRRSGDAVDYQASAVPVTPGYFAALQVRLLAGRFFTEADDARQPPVMIMSDATARRFFGAGDPIGKTMALPVLRNGARESVEMTLVGVTANVKYAGLDVPPDDVVYRPFAQQPWVAPFLVVRTTGRPEAFAASLQRSIAVVDRRIVTSAIAPLDRLVRDAAAQPEFRTLLLGALAILATTMAAVGLYGVVAFAVSQRTREIGIRVALGATSARVLRLVLREGVMVAAAGIGAGTLGAVALARVTGGLLYEISPTDPVSFLGAAAGVLGLALIACYVPARRAAGIDPVRALRAE